MAKIACTTVDEYIASQPEGARDALEHIRAAIRKAVPKAEESISYKIPTYKIDGGALLYFAGWKQHCSLYPASGPMIAAFRDELAPYEVEKGTIRFPLSEQMPTGLIGRIAKFRAQELAARETAKAAARAKH